LKDYMSKAENPDDFSNKKNASKKFARMVSLELQNIVKIEKKVEKKEKSVPRPNYLLRNKLASAATKRRKSAITTISEDPSNKFYKKYESLSKAPITPLGIYLNDIHNRKKRMIPSEYGIMQRRSAGKRLASAYVVP